MAPTERPPPANFAEHLSARAGSHPTQIALVAPDGRGGWSSWTYAELNALSDRLAHGLTALGVTRGRRTAFLVTPGPEFVALSFALFKTGAVLVAIDPGVGRRALLSCLEEVQPEAFIGVPKAHLARLLFPRAFRHVTTAITVGRRYLWGGPSLEDVLRAGRDEPFPAVRPAAAETAAILFTSGSTGLPKGVVYSHEHFGAQVHVLREAYGFTPGEVDLATFPLFALFSPAFGTTAVLPEMDFAAPGRADPAKLVEAVSAHRCTTMFASPAIVDVLGRHGVTLPSLTRVLSAGAPVRVDVLRAMAALLPDGAEIHTPYGATEALPVTSVGSREVLGETAALTAQGRGVCVGRPLPGLTVRLVRITDEPIAEWSPALEVPTGEAGEITVAGPVVTSAYFARPASTAVAKVREGAHLVHRMGDIGAFDERGRLWMYGRKGHRVQTPSGTLFSTPVEEVINTHRGVRRSALVGVGRPGAQVPVLLLEREPGLGLSDAALVTEVKALAARHLTTQGLAHVHVYPHEFPVDRRHNAKIEREALAAWATSRGLGRRVG